MKVTFYNTESICLNHLVVGGVYIVGALVSNIVVVLVSVSTIIKLISIAYSYQSIKYPNSQIYLGVSSSKYDYGFLVSITIMC